MPLYCQCLVVVLQGAQTTLRRITNDVQDFNLTAKKKEK